MHVGILTRDLARTHHACHFDRYFSVFDEQKLPILDYFRPFWAGTLSNMMGNFKILAKVWILILIIYQCWAT